LRKRPRFSPPQPHLDLFHVVRRFPFGGGASSPLRGWGFRRIQAEGFLFQFVFFLRLQFLVRELMFLIVCFFMFEDAFFFFCSEALWCFTCILVGKLVVFRTFPSMLKTAFSATSVFPAQSPYPLTLSFLCSLLVFCFSRSCAPSEVAVALLFSGRPFFHFRPRHAQVYPAKLISSPRAFRLLEFFWYILLHTPALPDQLSADLLSLAGSRDGLSPGPRGLVPFLLTLGGRYFSIGVLGFFFSLA